MYPAFQPWVLDKQHVIWQGQLPSHLLPTPQQFEPLWALHPDAYNTLKIHGRLVQTPRWEQAYNKFYGYSGIRHGALPTPNLLRPYWNWVRQTLDDRLNGILVSWYDGQQGHYIGKHRDSTQNMVKGAPIVTISLGQERVFRLRPWKGKGYQDFPLHHGTVMVLPYATNQAWTHEVPPFKAYRGKRMAIAFRAFY